MSDELSQKRADHQEALYHQVYLRIEAILKHVQDETWGSDKYQMIDTTSRRVSVYPLGDIAPTRIDTSALNIDIPLVCDCFLYLGTDGTIYAYGLGNDAQEGAVLKYREVDLKAEDTPLQRILDLLNMVVD